MSAERNPPAPEPDEFDRLLLELTSGQAGPARFREPSAAERARNAAQARPVGRAPSRRARRLRLRQALVRAMSMLVVAALLGYAAYALVLHRRISPAPGIGSSPAPGTPSPPRTTPAGQVPPLFSLTDPFKDSPAASYLVGAAGIVVPAAGRAGRYTAAQVAAAYASAKKLIIAAELDQPTMLGGSPRAFIRALTPGQRSEFERGLNRQGLGKHGYPRSTRTWITSFAPGTSMVGSVIKVRGTMTALAASDNGRRVLRVHVNYLIVYPVERTGQPATRIRVVAHLIGNVDFAQWDSAGGPMQAWWLAAAGAAGAQCGTTDGYVHPAFGGAQGKVPPSGIPVNPYQLNPPSSQAKCQATTGT